MRRRPTLEEVDALRQALVRTPLSADDVDRVARRGYMVLREVRICLDAPAGSLSTALYGRKEIQPLRDPTNRVYTPHRYSPWDVLAYRQRRLAKKAAKRGNLVTESDPGLVRQIVVLA